MSQLILFNKPFRVMSQFSPCDDKRTLADFINIPAVYPAGRLDYDSEGLLLLTDDGLLQHRIAHPAHKQPKRYWVQVEGVASDEQIDQLRRGVALSDGPTLPARVRRIDEPALWERDPPIRVRQSVPTCWLEIIISEGRNRQVRRMTAAVGLPTLRLVRTAIGDWSLDDLKPGEWRRIEVPVAGSSRPLPPSCGRRRSRPARRGPQRV
jgi:23S rRNA pseudouridine2457 synthase